MPISVKQILIDERLIAYLKSRKLIAQYRKAKGFILSGKAKNVDLKLREPKDRWIWYFRINKQYRAHCTYKDNALRIHKIDDHS